MVAARLRGLRLCLVLCSLAGCNARVSRRKNSMAAGVNCSELRFARGARRLRLSAACWPPGHLQPFGGWRPSLPVEERLDMPSPREFFSRYASADAGAGKPLILRGAAKKMAAMQWSDEQLIMSYGHAPIDSVEVGLKETRVRGAVSELAELWEFIAVYNYSDLHLISEMPHEMLDEVDILPLLSCGGFLNFLFSQKLWMSRGRSRSVVHQDDTEGMNCQIAGRKRFAMVHPRWRSKAEAKANQPGRADKFGFIDTRLDSEAPGYGAYFGRVDVDAVDLDRYPGWAGVEWYLAELNSGDCLYIPHGWYHQVSADRGRTLNVQVWYWRPERFDAASCSPQRRPRRQMRFSDCSWGYTPLRGGAPVGTRSHAGRAVPVTRCIRRERLRRRTASWVVAK
eukprot:TRINITY_DN22728_c0_g1_i1.p1 TRINITY_DN22728_c0_g1~~TRINITY_DN22728_c0_g1_i1.p1  ORF type:complete len:396 (+),score=47.34 TRINITY_DN22728_c0_g1_i1:95-1282(+)